MKNTFLDKYKKTLVIKVSGRNISRYINKAIKNKILWTDLKIYNRNECTFKINENDLDNVEKTKGIYKIEIIKLSGMLEIKNKINKNKYIFIFLILGISIIIFLSNVIFEVEVIHNNSEIKKLLYKELENNNIKKYTFKKTYDELQTIKKIILENNKEKLEWIEIETLGTKYVIKVEERKLKENIDNIGNSHIIAKKSGIIKYIYASSGEVIRKKDEYVKEGDIIISGEITRPNSSVILKPAIGKVYAEVWKTVSVDYPLTYKEEILTGKAKEIFILNIFNKRISLFDFDKYATFKPDKKIIYENNFKNINLTKEKQYEMNVIDEVWTIDEVIDKAKALSIKKVKETLKEDERILDYIVLEHYEDGSSIHMKIFFKILENIGISKKIEESPLT